MDAVREKAMRARAAALRLGSASDEERRRATLALADAISNAAARIRAANEADLADASSLAPPLRSRLRLGAQKLSETLDGVRQVAALPDPLGRIVRGTLLDDGLELRQMTVPLGVLACVFESRPDAAIQIPALAIRSGNAVLLKGGAEAARTNAAIAEAIRAALPWPDAVQLLDGRAEARALLAHDDLVDLVIPRGSSEFVRDIMASTRIPVLGHASGVCHVFVDKAADAAKALAIALDGKTDNPAACNAMETLIVHRDIAAKMAPWIKGELEKRGVKVSEDPADYGKEFGDLRCTLAVVDSVEDAAAFIAKHGSRHTDVIVTEDADAARRFVALVDSAGVFVNASPRFADGYRYGLGAEVGVSTSKLHARGPVGLEGLTTTKWVLTGRGHVASSYQGAEAKRFKHEPLALSKADAPERDGGPR